MSVPSIGRLNIAAKLLLWSCALIAIFFATTAYLYTNIERDAEGIRAIVNENHAVDVACQRMIETLLSVQDNIRRYKVLGVKEALTYVVEDLTRFGKILNETLKDHPRLQDEWVELTQEYSITLDPGKSPGDALNPDATVQDWLGILEQTSLENQADLQTRLEALYASGRRAADIGFWGLAVCLVLGLFGSLFLAYRINRSLTEVRQGILGLGQGGPPQDVRVLSGDELGELATAFNRMAERLRREERMRSDFIAMLSHEIRTPLTSILEAVDLVGTGAFGAVNEKQAHFLGIAEQETERLRGLLERLMSVTRMESGVIDLRLAAVDVGSLVASTMERLEPLARTKSIELVSEVEAPVAVTADLEHLRQVLLNLAGNAMKFSPQGSRVVLSATAKGDQVEICVADQGPGIPEEERGRVFEKYYRGPEARDSVDGAGLGLAISLRIVQAHAGTMWVEDNPGGGARFCVSISVGPKAGEQHQRGGQ